MKIIRNPVFKESLVVLGNEKNLHKLAGYYILFLFCLLLLTGPKEVTTYAQTAAVPLFHLFAWYGIIIGMIGINLYWAGERNIVNKYSHIKKWFTYAGITPIQFFTGKLLQAFTEILILMVFTSPFIIIPMAVSGFYILDSISVFLIIFINIYLCRFISIYFHSTFSGPKFPFSLPFLFMYFWLILLYIGTFFLFPYAHIFSVVLTLEPSCAHFFSSILDSSMITIPWLNRYATNALSPVPLWLISFYIHLIILIFFKGFFYVKLLLLKNNIRYSHKPGKGTV